MKDKNIYDYCEKHTTPESMVQAELNRITYLTQMNPRMLAGHLQGVFLRMISRMVRPHRILEIGTFTGYSAINLANGLASGGILHTIEINPEQEEIIRKYIGEAGFEDRIILHIGEALKIIPMMNEPWDLVYIDADKENYLNYYKMLIDRLHPGCFILADNTLWDGKVLLEKSKMDKETLGIAEFNEFVNRDDRVENIILPLRDGIMMIRKL